MKANNKKLKSILSLIVAVVVIGLVSVLAYKACLNVGQGQVTDMTQLSDKTENTEASDVEPAGNANEEATDGTTSGDEETTDTETDKVAENETITDADAQEATDDTVEEAKEPSFFERNKIKLGLDLQGGVDIVYEPQLDEGMSDEEVAEAMEAAQALIQTRLDSNGYTEAEVMIEGGTRLRVDIPGVDDPQQAITEIGAAGMIYFYDQPIFEEGKEVTPILTGQNIAEARAAQNTQTGEYVVSIQLDDEGTKIFDEYTAAHQGETIYIYLDDMLLSYPTLSAHITDGSGQISGNFTLEGAQSLANNINAGALPFTLKAIGAESVGAKLGADALRTSLLAGVIGFITILIFMVVMYRLCGVASSIALVLYVGLEILVLSMMNATLTLPGIAGILLSIGMAVDANVIIFARIKEELSVGKSVRLAVDAGFNKAFKAIIDGNITTLIAATVLYFFGTGLIKSFATTLMVGIIISMFTALIVTRFILKAFVGMNIRNASLFASIKKTGKEA